MAKNKSLLVAHIPFKRRAHLIRDLLMATFKMLDANDIEKHAGFFFSK